MRGLLVSLCAIVTLLATFAGGCAVLFSGIVVFGGGDGNEFLLATLPAMAVAFSVMAVNVALIAALGRGKAPRRSPLFVTLAVVDLIVAAALAAGIVVEGPLLPAGLLPAALALKGLLTLLLPAEPSPSPPADASREDA